MMWDELNEGSKETKWHQIGVESELFLSKKRTTKIHHNLNINGTIKGWTGLLPDSTIQTVSSASSVPLTNAVHQKLHNTKSLKRVSNL